VQSVQWGSDGVKVQYGGKKGGSDLNRSCEALPRVRSIAHKRANDRTHAKVQMWPGGDRTPLGAWRESERSPQGVQSFASSIATALLGRVL
jgi:hypothetical protein